MFLRYNLKFLNLIAGPLAFSLVYFYLAKQWGLPEKTHGVAAMAIWLAIWWSTEAIPIAATSLLPIVSFPLLDISSTQQVTQNYGHHLIFLFLGGFILAMGLERWNIHKRIALKALLTFGTHPARLLIGFMVTTAFISMWVTNTATTLLMLPIALSVIRLFEEQQTAETTNAIAHALLLGIAYAASIGGLGTIVGTVPNAILVGYLENSFSIEITFFNWIQLGIPTIMMLLPTCMIILLKSYRLNQLSTSTSKQTAQELRHGIYQQLKKLGPLTYEQWIVSLVVGLSAFLWIMRPFIKSQLPYIKIDDTTIALFCALLLFVIPQKQNPKQALLSWQEARRLPWGVLLLFGGGLSLAAALKESGLAEWIAHQFIFLQQVSPLIAILVIAAAIIFLTELTSNTATVASFLPIIGAIFADSSKTLLPVLVALTLSASCAFMFPVATPPNAIVFGSEKVNIQEMIRIGLRLNLACLVLITLCCYFLVPLILTNPSH